MKSKILLIVSAFTIISFNSLAVDLEEGKSMYQEDCLSCHDSSVFTRPSKERKVNNLETLKKQVHRCVGATGSSWFEEDEENVVAYLNKEFYNFSKK